MTQQEYENKIKELQDELEQLKAAKIEAEQPKRWKPQDDEKYWLVKNGGNISYVNWEDDDFDEWHYSTGNCFKTKEKAEEYKKQIEYTARYKNYIEEHSEPINWKNAKTLKYYAYMRIETREIEVDHYDRYKIQGTIFASNGQVIWDAIKEIGEYNFKKYVLGEK